MKIGFLCPSLSRTAGGIFEIEQKLAQALSRLPLTSIEVSGPSDEHTQADLPSWLPLRPRHYKYIGPSSFRYSNLLQRAVVASDVDLVHLHALWMHNSVVTNAWARRWGRPYVITANGMLEQWALRNSGWKKRIALTLYERTCLKGAACIQVNSQAEYESVRTLGLRNPVCIIPNGIDLPEDDNAFDRPDLLAWNDAIPEGQHVLLYLGRLHPKKGLVNLLKAWAKASSPHDVGWTLVIAGWDQNGHEAELKDLAAELDLSKSVVFAGPQFGKLKSACYRACDAFVLPSFSEGLPMVVLEAWSYGKPALMTPACNLPAGFAVEAAHRIEPTVEGIADGLRNLFSLSDEQRKGMGNRGRTLVQNQFNWPTIAADMRAVYAWTVGSGPKPDCIVN